MPHVAGVSADSAEKNSDNGVGSQSPRAHTEFSAATETKKITPCEIRGFHKYTRLAIMAMLASEVSPRENKKVRNKMLH